RPRALSLAVQLVLLSLWIGATVLFAAVVAPALFAVLPSRATAGEVVGRILPVLLYTGIAISLVAALLETMGAARIGAHRAGASLPIGLVCALAVWVGQRIDKLTASIGQPIDALPADDPRRTDFGRLHALSVALLGVAMLVAVGLAVPVARR